MRSVRGLHVRWDVKFAIEPPIEPMLAKLADDIPAGDDVLYEPKWDGFRALVFRGEDEVYIQSRDLRPLDRYFPELHDALLAGLPAGCVIDGEIVIATPKGLDFDALQLRLHPAASRVAKLAKETPSRFVAFDLLAADGVDLRAAPQAERRAALERLLRDVKPPIHVTPMTRDRAVALDWHRRFEGAGLDGVMVKPAGEPYHAGKRAMIKVKHSRTADCVVAGAVKSSNKLGGAATVPVDMIDSVSEVSMNTTAEIVVALLNAVAAPRGPKTVCDPMPPKAPAKSAALPLCSSTSTVIS